ncbi:hypothetical protein PN36_34090 [Candidatus Thiomargarita nelsonii]|uniref:Helix-turn-helix domain-containing protein n=1 Tax=Candidatus Thiomargarita nelsonii TaxID=1003181 RepID=A0A4E0QR56_9GAMM|nr:hypothetical protein PN36_34090 [Candidatus Thiomargarita nelsonii]
MEKLSICEAYERFGLSRARLYQLVDKGIVAGHRSDKKGRGAESWIDGVTLKQHLKIRDKKARMGGVCAKPDGDYLPTRIAAEKTGYTARHINLLIKQGSVASKKKGRFNLVYYPSLLWYIK